MKTITVEAEHSYPVQVGVNSQHELDRIAKLHNKILVVVPKSLFNMKSGSESNQLKISDDIKQDLEEIFLELQEEGYQIDFRFDDYSPEFDNPTIVITRPGFMVNTDDYGPFVFRAINYIKSKGLVPEIENLTNLARKFTMEIKSK